MNLRICLATTAASALALVAVGGATFMTATGARQAVAETSPSTEGARFTLSPVDGGFVRLDKQTGAMSICKKQDDTWACQPMADASGSEREEIEKLKAQNSDLKEEIRRMEEVFGLSGEKKPTGPLAGPPGGMPEFQLPSEKDVDQAVDYLEGMIRKFRERFEDFGDKTDPDRPRSQPRAQPEGGDTNGNEPRPL